ncbi:sigma factor binding protein 2, chloroplastic [Fagus crenata]
MEHLRGVNHVKGKRQAKGSKKGVKVVYIASPMKVKTSASKFRDLVQELTGQDSDTARYMEEVNNGADHQGPFNFSDQQLGAINDEVSKLPLTNSYGEFLPYPDPFFKSFNEHLLHLDELGSFAPM